MGKSFNYKVKKENYNFINAIAVIACLAVIVVILTVLFASYIFDKAALTGDTTSESHASSKGEASENPPESAVSESGNESPGVQSEPTQSEDPVGDAYQIIDVPVEEMRRGSLIVVNSQNVFDFAAADDLVTISSKRTKNYKLIDQTPEISAGVIDPLNAMLDGLYDAADTNALTIIAAYRDFEKQQSLYESGKDTVPGGKSDLHTGLSFRCTVYPPEEGNINEGKFRWLSENCKAYGFVFRYPEGKSSITGHPGADDYFRYVGLPHAYLMALNDYCLEEYIDFCSRFSYENQYKFDYEGTRYAIYYCKAAPAGDTPVKIPEGADYTLSGDNISGFIITVTLNSPGA